MTGPTIGSIGFDVEVFTSPPIVLTPPAQVTVSDYVYFTMDATPLEHQYHYFRMKA